jgi:hypothetical protein
MNIDDLLREYVAQPVPQGLEARVMRRVRAESRRWQWGWLAPSLIAACLALAIWVRPVTHRTPSVVSHPSSTVAARKNPDVARAKRRTDRRLNPSQALWRFARKHPEATASLAIEYESTPIVPLQIEPISIEELDKQ